MNATLRPTLSTLPLLALLGVIAPACVDHEPPIRESSTTAAARSGADDPTIIARDAATTAAMGAADPVVLVSVFVDLQCKFCRTTAATIDRVGSGFGDDVQVQLRHFPLTNIHPQAFDAAVAVQAAHRQGQAFCMLRALFARQRDWRVDAAGFEPAVAASAAHCGLDEARFAADRQDARVSRKVLDDIAVADGAGVRATPTVLVNGVRAELAPKHGRSTEKLLSALIRREIAIAREQLEPGESRHDFVAERIYLNVADEAVATEGEGARAEAPPASEESMAEIMQRAETTPATLLD